MRHRELAMVFSIKEINAPDDVLRAHLWQETVKILTPALGKIYGRFEPAGSASGQSIHTACSTLLGRSEPAMFMYFYAHGKAILDHALQHHMKGILDNLDVEEKRESEKVIAVTMKPKEGAKDALNAHVFWQMSIMDGLVMPDSGIYLASERCTIVGEAKHNEILQNMKDYAIVMVRFYEEACDADL